MTREVQMLVWLISSAIATASTISLLTVMAVKTSVFLMRDPEQRVFEHAGRSSPSR